MTWEELCSKYTPGYAGYKPNIYELNTNEMHAEESSIDEFNEIYALARTLPHKLEFTKSGGICTKRGKVKYPCYGVKAGRAKVSLVILYPRYGDFHFYFGFSREEESTISGSKALDILKKELKADGIDLNNYAVTPAEGLRIKEEINPPHIELIDAVPQYVYLDAHHIDFNSAYFSNIIEEYPELTTTIQRIYDNRKKDEKYKMVLNASVGAMQSVRIPYVGARYAILSKIAINKTRSNIELMVKEMKDCGIKVLATNTDGVWFQYEKELQKAVGVKGYDPDGLQNKLPSFKNCWGNELGQYKIDHANCAIRFKSKGAYEFLEIVDGKEVYTPVVRGWTKYDYVKPRSEWEWGDIFKGGILKWRFYEDRGIVYGYYD